MVKMCKLADGIRYTASPIEFTFPILDRSLKYDDKTECTYVCLVFFYSAMMVAVKRAFAKYRHGYKSCVGL